MSVVRDEEPEFVLHLPPSNTSCSLVGLQARATLGSPVGEGHRELQLPPYVPWMPMICFWVKRESLWKGEMGVWDWRRLLFIRRI